jgi:hypothetical protein
MRDEASPARGKQKTTRIMRKNRIVGKRDLSGYELVVLHLIRKNALDYGDPLQYWNGDL